MYCDQRAESSSCHLFLHDALPICSLLRVWPATVRAAERAMEWGKHFKIRPPHKDDTSHMESAEARVCCTDRRSISSTTSDGLKREALGTEGRIFCAPTRAGAPHLR